MNEKNIAVLGTSYGDEGKARIVHWMAKNYNWVLRFGGSSNAGHTIYHNGTKIVRHLLPSADFAAGNKAFLGSGMVINPDELLAEVEQTEIQFPGSASRIYVDPDAFVVMPEHIAEDKEKNKGIGSTGKGVTPAYRDKIDRKGTRIHQYIGHQFGSTYGDSIHRLAKLGVQFTYSMELKEQFDKESIIFEGSQAILLDIAFGTYPYVTSGETGLAGIINSGFARYMPSKVYGVTKAYSTRVGNGPFVTEMEAGEIENHTIRERGNEYGSTTGRSRRIGWIDLPSIKYAAHKAAITDLVVTKLDVLNGFKKIQVCDEYVSKWGNDHWYEEPKCSSNLDSPILYKTIDGWENSKDMGQTKQFRNMIENGTGVKISHLSCGVNEDDIITL